MERAQSYMPGLDGLRAYLMLTILLFHCKVPGFSGGWISVDVFFALSGVLITRNLVMELDRTGTVSISQFWARRSRRLLPGLVTVLAAAVVLVAVGALTLRPSAAWGAVTYTTNWVHILVPGNGYWDAFAEPDPFEHLWSLAVEEQFYLVWPLVVLALARRGRRAVAVTSLVLAAASVGMQLIGVAADWSIDRLYQGTDTRAVPFLLGAFVACVGVPRTGRVVGAAAVTASLAVLAYTTHRLDGSQTSVYLGPLQLVSVAGVVVVAWSAQTRSAVMCNPVARALGRWSYGIYLFHWPLAVLLPSEWGWEPRVIVVGLAATALAAASHRLIESPIRFGSWNLRHLVPAVAVTAAIAVATVVIAAPLAMEDRIARAEQSLDWDGVAATRSAATDDSTQGGTSSESQPPPVAVGTAAVEREPVETWPASPYRVLVIGDSTANVLASGLESTGRFDVVDGGMWGCPLVEAIEVRSALDVERSAEYCPGREDQIAAITFVQPDVVVAIASATEVWDHRYATGDWTSPGETAWRDEHDRHMEALVAAHPDVPIVLVPAPTWRPPTIDALETPERRAEWNAQIDRWVDMHPQLLTMEYARYLPEPGTAKDREMRPDGAHITEEWIARLAEDHLADDLVTAYRRIVERLGSRN